ncbi:hypothetical protein F4553_000157 [Allocatelliglobosispora scoriae]|uniref:Uncharacterized protein n=1 Tax=Allocatelliglobosispora scoriae TaxID=643052 RepID=A0A841BHI2_9ACTN|nr:hypothetical protein [Allocatelliglobosispora scoriae]MBB5866778.1 hypothetical protein [Allocatelliglobosispora scoriae]
MALTDAWAWLSEQGWADEQAVPDPVDEAYSVVMTAAAAGVAATADTATSIAAAYLATVVIGRDVRRGAVRGAGVTMASFLEMSCQP